MTATAVDARSCPVTGRPLGPEWYVSQGGVERLRRALTDLSGLLDDLTGTMARQLRFGDRGAGKSAETPLVFNPKAGEHYRTLTRALVRDVVWISQVRGHPAPTTWGTLGTYLHREADWLARHPEGERIIPALLDLLDKARTLVDRPPDKAYAGRCGNTLPDVHAPDPSATVECDGQLYATPGATETDCPRCGRRWPVQSRRDHMLERIEHMTMPAAQLAQTLTAITGVPVDAARIRKWKERGKVEPVGVNVKGQPVYLVSEVIERMRGDTRDNERVDLRQASVVT